MTLRDILDEEAARVAGAMKPGVYTDLSYDKYARINAVRSSDLKLFTRTPAHARYAMMHPEQSAAMVLGNATHVAILEPDKFARTYVVAPKLDRRTTAGKAAWQQFLDENKDRIPLSAEEHEVCCAMQKAVAEFPLAHQLVSSPGKTEATVVWEDAATGLRCKARLDRFMTLNGYSTIVDLKTARDASERGFARDAANFAYHLQAAWYLRGCDALSPVPRRFVFIVVEKEPPHCVALYELDEQFLAAGRALCDRTLALYARSMETGHWPGYRAGIGTLYAPSWITTNYEGDEE